MKKFFSLILIILSVLFTLNSCIDLDEAYEDNQKQLQKYYDQIYAQFGKDTVLIEKYLADSSLVAQKDSSGIYYIIENSGDDQFPNDNSIIEVYYKGCLLDGTVFNQTYDETSYSCQLRSTISGWRIGVPLIGTGGKIKLFVPSYYGYGSSDYGYVPANSVLIFEIELLSFY